MEIIYVVLFVLSFVSLAFLGIMIFICQMETVAILEEIRDAVSYKD